MKVIIVTHKDRCLLDSPIFSPIQVGAKNSGYTIDQEYYKDNVSYNISEKNPNYSELTALYWMWKNMKDEDILGLNHYRRYFNFLNHSIFKPHRIKEVSHKDKIISKHNNETSYIKKRIEKWLTSYDVILPYVRTLKISKKEVSITEEYCARHFESDWKKTLEIIETKYPEYKPSIEKYFNKSGEIYLMNVFVAKQKWVDIYCKWLFDILFELEKNITISDDPYQKRVFGFISERLLTLYVKHNEFKVKQLPLIFIRDMFKP